MVDILESYKLLSTKYMFIAVCTFVTFHPVGILQLLLFFLVSFPTFFYNVLTNERHNNNPEFPYLVLFELSSSELKYFCETMLVLLTSLPPCMLVNLQRSHSQFLILFLDWKNCILIEEREYKHMGDKDSSTPPTPE